MHCLTSSLLLGLKWLNGFFVICVFIICQLCPLPVRAERYKQNQIFFFSLLIAWIHIAINNVQMTVGALKKINTMTL